MAQCEKKKKTRQTAESLAPLRKFLIMALRKTLKPAPQSIYYIWTVATAALQELDRQLQAERGRNDSLEARILALENK